MKSIQLFPVYIKVPLFSVFLFLTNFVETPFVSLIRLAHSFPRSHGYMSVSIRRSIRAVNMGKRCSADVCKTNYDSEKQKNKKAKLDAKIRLFSFPSDPAKRTAWVSALPNVLEKVTKNMGVCEKHWPPNLPTIRVKGHDLPLNPPSIWSVPDSFCKQHKSHDRAVMDRGIDAESRRSIHICAW